MKTYKFGPGNPPLETRFKPGNQEWRKREAKRKASRDFSPANDIRAVLGSPVLVKQNGEIREEVRLQAIVDSLIASALNGDVGAAKALIGFHLDAEALGDLQKPMIIFDEPGDEDF